MRIQRHHSIAPFGGPSFGLGAWLAQKNSGLGISFINGPGSGTMVPVPPVLDPSSSSGGAAAPDTATLLANAKKNLIAAGYAGAECHTETVYYPNGGGGSYTQNICSAPGYTGGSEANLVALMTPQQLQAQRAYEQGQGEGTSATPSNFQLMAGAPNIAITNSTAGAGAPGANTASGNVAPDWFSTLQSQLNKITTQVTGAAAPPATPTTPGAAAPPATSLLSGLDTKTSTIVSGIPDIFIYAAGGVAALILIMKMGK